eukprot:scaffold1060_cov385-Pavlova_lutheri.AAC.15
MRKDFTNPGTSLIRTFAFMGDKTDMDVNIDGKHKHEGCGKDKAFQNTSSFGKQQFLPSRPTTQHSSS